MSNRGRVTKECGRENMVRRVEQGRVDHGTFFRNVTGHLLMSGALAPDTELTADLVCEYAERNDMPSVVLTGQRELLKCLRDRQQEGLADGIMVSAPDSRNYHPMYGMTAQQVCRLFRTAGEEVGCSGLMDRVLLYAASVIQIAAARYPVSLPAISALLKEDDDFIASFARQMGLSNVTADNILGSHEAGIMLRRIVERMEEALEGVALGGSDTKYNIQSGSKGHVPVMALYQISGSQGLMNLYLKEELYGALKRVPRLRVILHEAVFLDETDELMAFLLQMKRQGKIELIASSRNVRAMLPGASLDFENVCLFQHSSPVATEELSRDLFGTYQYHYPTCMAGRPPAVLFTLRRDIRWQSAAEERLRVRAEDLYGRRRLLGSSSDNVAVKTTYDPCIYMVPADEFISIRRNGR